MSDAIRPSISALDRAKPPAAQKYGSKPHHASGPAFLEVLDRPSTPKATSGQILPRALDLIVAPNGDARFNVPLAKSDHAVAFDARAVVGPTSVATPEVEAVKIEGAGPETAGRWRLDLLRNELLGVPAPVEIRSPSSELITVSAATHAIGLRKAASGTHTAQPMATNAWPQIATVVDRPQVSETVALGQFPDLDLGPVEASGRSRQTIEQQQARGNLLARIIASDQDYRLLIRGSALDPLQVRSIKRAIGNLLRSFGLPDMPVQISWHRKGK